MYPEDEYAQRVWHGAAWLSAAAGYAENTGHALAQMRESGLEGVEYGLYIARKALERLEAYEQEKP